MIKQEFHAIKGIQRDLTVSKFSPEYAFDAQNIRLTARDGNNLLSVTNEKGTKELILKSTSGAVTSVEGTLIGYNVLNEYLTLFTTGDTDRIYRLENKGDYFETILLFSGNMNFSVDSPIENIGVYENDNIQKVYWVDGRNQPRVINIVADDTAKSHWNEGSFDFVQELELRETVTVERNDLASGLFSSGIIQYAFTYYNKYGQESNIFYTSPIQYISFSSRGASSEERVSCSFTITIENPDTKFDYVRVYSIHRASIDATPNVLNVVDLPINPSTTRDSVVLTYTDNGTTGTSVDPTELLYVGGQEVVFGTMAQKDNTLFLGNADIKQNLINTDIVNSIRGGNVYFSQKYVGNYVRHSGYYPYKNSLYLGSKIKSFKYLEWYRFGIQFQYNNGRWSEPIWINDSYNNTAPSYNDSLSLVQASYNIPSAVINSVVSQGFKRARGVVVYPSLVDREVVAQGMLCPTVYNVGDRFSNSPFAQASWFSRPNSAFDYKKSKEPVYLYNFTVSDTISASVGDRYAQGALVFVAYAIQKDSTGRITNLVCEGSNHGYPNTSSPSASGSLTLSEGAESSTVTVNYSSFTEAYSADWNKFNGIFEVGEDSPAGVWTNYDTIVNYNGTSYTMGLVNKGAIAEFRHNYPIPNNWERNAEIQCIANTPENPYTADSKSELSYYAANNGEFFFVDQNIVTMHSPDIEFDENIQNIDSSGLKLRIVGVIPITANASDIDIQTTTPANDVNKIGFYKEPVGVENNSYHGYKNLISGAYWFDKMYDMEKVDDDHGYSEAFFIYAWHRNGSLNNQGPTTDESPRTAMLSHKKISNLKFSSFVTYFNTPWYAYMEGDNNHTGITGVNIFNSNEQSLVRIPSPANSNLGDLNYYGNIDKVLIPSRIDDEYTLTEIFSDEKRTETFNRKNGYPIVVTGVNDAEEFAHKLFSGGTFPIQFVKRSDGATLTKTPNGTDPVSIKYKSTPHAVFAFNYTKDGRQVILPSTKSTNYSNVWEVNDGNVEKGTYVDHFFWNPIAKNSSDNVYDGVYQDSLSGYTSNTVTGENGYGYLFLAELYKDDVVNRFGGQTEEAFENNQWLPAGEPVELTDASGAALSYATIYYTEGDTFLERYDCLKTYPYTLEDQNSVTEIVSFMCETRVNIEGRYDRNRGQLSNLTMTPTNFNLVNDVYSQKNNFFNYRGVNYSKYSLNYFPNTITWTKEKQLGSIVDTWTNITMASTLDLDGDKGEVVSLNTFNNEIYCFQRRGLSNILFNSRVQIPTSDGVPIEITNGLKVSGKRYVSNSIGCSNKWSIVESPSGLYFIDNETNSLYLFNSQIQSLSDKLGFRQWVSDNNSHENWDPVNYNNFRSFYDKNNNDVYFIDKDECLCYSELLGQFTSFMSYEKVPAMFNIGSEFYSFNKSKLWQNFEGDYNMFYGEFKPYSITVVANSDEPYDKIFNNIEFRADSWDGDTLINAQTFDTLDVWNEYQHGTSTLSNVIGKPSSLKKKFRVWRANVPRDNSNKRDRIRNTWAYVKLSMNAPNTWKTEFHDMMVHYFI